MPNNLFTVFDKKKAKKKNLQNRILNRIFFFEKNHHAEDTETPESSYALECPLVPFEVGS